MVLSSEQLILYILVAAVFAIIYSLRVLVLLERRIAKMDENIEQITRKVLGEEYRIEKLEKRLLKKKR